MANIKNIKDAQKEQPAQGQTVNRDELEPVVCAAEDCEGTIFQQAHKFGRLSPVHPNNTTAKLQLVPFQTFVCVACGTEIPAGE